MVCFHKKKDPREYVKVCFSDFEPVYHSPTYWGQRIDSDKGFSGFPQNGLTKLRSDKKDKFFKKTF